MESPGCLGGRCPDPPLYPLVASDDFDGPLPYLFRRLEENAAAENFLAHLPMLGDENTFAVAGASHGTGCAGPFALQIPLQRLAIGCSCWIRIRTTLRGGTRSLPWVQHPMSKCALRPDTEKWSTRSLRRVVGGALWSGPPRRSVACGGAATAVPVAVGAATAGLSLGARGTQAAEAEVRSVFILARFYHRQCPRRTMADGRASEPLGSGSASWALQFSLWPFHWGPPSLRRLCCHRQLCPGLLVAYRRIDQICRSPK